MKKGDLGMVELIIAGVIGLAIGIGGAIVGGKMNRPTIIQAPSEEIAKEQIEVQKNLTQTDLAQEACSKDFIVDQEQGALLCRELFCRMQQRGIDAQTSQSDCEAISNTANSLEILSACSEKEGEERRTCEELFFKRK